MEPLYNTLNSGESVSVAIPLPDNTIPGASFKVAIYRGGAWEELDGHIGDQAVYARVTGDLGPMILVQKPSQAVYYFDNSVYSNQQVTRIEIDLMIKESAVTANPPGTFTLTYTDYSVSPSGTNDSILINFERLADSTLIARSINTFYGRVVVNSASVNISSPDSVTYTVSNVFDLDQGQSLLITIEKTVSEMKGNANNPDKLVFSYGGNNLAFEYTSLNGEGQIRKGSAGSYYYNYYLKDHLGSTRMVINDAGDITDAIMYQPYGTMEEVAGIATPGADPERERFTGKEFDREGEDTVYGVPGLNAYYFGARFHDPEIGMWMSVDPADQFWNAYVYCSSNPIILTDPNGKTIAYTEAFENVNSFAFKFMTFLTEHFFKTLERLATSEHEFNIYLIGSLAGLVGGSRNYNRLMLGMIDPDGFLDEMQAISSTADDIATFVPPAKIFTSAAANTFTYGPHAINWMEGKLNSRELAIDLATTSMSELVGNHFEKSEMGKFAKVVGLLYNKALGNTVKFIGKHTK